MRMSTAVRFTEPIRKRLVAPVLLLLLSLSSYAQQDNTLFMMHNIPQSNFLNPAVQISCPKYIAIPLLSSIHFNFNSTGFSYSTLTRGSSLDAGSLVGKMHSWDYLATELHYTPVSFGFMYDSDQYFNFSWTERVESKLFVSRKLLSLFANGNAQYVGQGLSTSNPGLNAHYYREFSLGYSRRMEGGTLLGLHVKLLFGLAGLVTRRNPVTLEVNPLTYDIDAKWQPEVNISYPLTVSTDATGHVTGISLKGPSLPGFLLNFGNPGLAFDFGLVKRTDELVYSASLLDLGLIWWRKDATRLLNRGNFVYRGATTADLADPTAYINELADSINRQVQFTTNNRGYFTLLSPKLYLGVARPVHEQLLLGGHIRSEWYPGRPVVSATLSATLFGVKGGSLALTYSAISGSFMNVGVGLGWGGEQFQFYLTTDNIMPAFFPEKARNVNFRFGFNLFLGCKGEKKGYSIPISNGRGCFWTWDLEQRKRNAGVK